MSLSSSRWGAVVAIRGNSSMVKIVLKVGESNKPTTCNVCVSIGGKGGGGGGGGRKAYVCNKGFTTDNKEEGS